LHVSGCVMPCQDNNMRRNYGKKEQGDASGKITNSQILQQHLYADAETFKYFDTHI